MPPSSSAHASGWLRSHFSAQPTLLLIICLALLAFVVAYQAPASQVVQVGEPGADASIAGFYFPEHQDGHSYRWSGPAAQVRFDGVGRRPWRLALRLSAIRPSGTVPVTVTVNGDPLAHLELGGAMSEQSFPISPQQVGPLANVSVGLASPTFNAPPDKRQLGLMVEWARLEPDGLAVTLPPLQILSVLLICLLFCYFGMRRWGMPAGWSFVPVVALTLLGLAGIILGRPQLVRYLPWCAAVLGLWWLFSRQLRRLRWWEWFALAAIAWAGWQFLVRALDFLNTSLPQGDFMIYWRAAANLRTGAPLYDYASARGIPLGPVYKYPPLFAILMAPVTVYQPWTVSAVAYVLNIALLFVALFLLLKWLPGSGQTRHAWYYLTILGFLLYTPAWEGIIRGQPDTLMLVCIAGAMLLLRTRRGQVWAGAILSFATMLKLYPGFLLLYLAWKRRWAAVAGFIGSFLIMTLVTIWGVGWQTCWRYVTDILTVQSGAAPYPENQSLNGFFARFVVPGPQVTWYTSVPFPRSTLILYYLAVLVTLLITVWLLSRVRGPESTRQFEMGYALLMPLTILIWPISWVHNEILLLLPYALVLLQEMQAARPSWAMLAVLLLSYLPTAYGNEYTALAPWLQQGWPRLLQSYKLYGVFVLWLAMLWDCLRDRNPATVTDSSNGGGSLRFRSQDARRPMTAKSLPQPGTATEATSPDRIAARRLPVGRRRVLAVGIGVGLLTLLAAFLRFWRLGAIPPGFHYDEALEALEAWRVLTTPGYHPIYFPGDFGLAPTYIYLSSLAFSLSAPSPALSRSIAAAIGTLTVPALFALAWELAALDESLPVATPLLAAAVLAVLRWHVTFSRVAIEPILVPLYLVIILWALLRGLRTNGVLAWLALGLALGLSLYSYPAAWLLPPLVAAIVIYLALTAKQRLSGRWRGLAAAGLLAALIALPLVLELAGHPGRVLQRAGQVAVAGSSGADQGVLTAIGSNLLKALGMFSFTGDGDPRSNLPGVPAIDPLLSIPFYLGAIVVIWRWKRPAYGILLLAAVFMLANTVFSQYAPHFRRAIGLTPVIALLCAIGLGIILEPDKSELGRRIQAAWTRRREAHASPAAAARGLGLARPIRVIVVVALLLGAAILSIRTYFVIWGQSADLYAAYDEGLWEIGNYVKTLPTDQSILITPRPAGDATLAFAWREDPAVRHFDGRHALVIPGDGRPAAYVVIEHEDFRATRLLHELYPAAPVTKTFADRDGRVYARVIAVPAGMPTVRRPRTTVDYSWPGIHLMGYDLDKTTYHPGDMVYLQFWWQATAPLSDTWTVFTHVLGPARADGSTVWAGKDAQPGQGTVPTTAWQPGDTILDEYQIQLGKDLPPGDYQLEIGLYNLAGGGKRAPTSNPAGQDHVVLGTLHVE